LQSFGKWYFRNMHSAVAAQKKEWNKLPGGPGL
jgi:hypothetical protein